MIRKLFSGFNPIFPRSKNLLKTSFPLISILSTREHCLATLAGTQSYSLKFAVRLVFPESTVQILRRKSLKVWRISPQISEKGYVSGFFF